MRNDADRLLRRKVVYALNATRWGVVGIGTGLLAFFSALALVVVAVLCAVGVGLLLLRPVLGAVRAVADLERERLNAMGFAVHAGYTPLPRRPAAVVRALRSEAVVRRDLLWLVVHGTAGLVLGWLLVQAPVDFVKEFSLTLWWYTLPDDNPESLQGAFNVRSWSDAAWLPFIGIGWGAVWIFLGPSLLRAQTWPGRSLLGSDSGARERIAALTASRAAALDAHAAELRRIERALHDGTQNRLVGVAVLAGAAKQQFQLDPERTERILGLLQDATEEALVELRSVARSILPPVLERRGLQASLASLAAACPVRCEVAVDAPRCPVSVEAAAYFAVAESLTNVAKYSGARRVLVEVLGNGRSLTVRVSDDGRGGADPAAGTGLAGIRDRAAAFDGRFDLASPVGGPTVVTVEFPCGDSHGSTGINTVSTLDLCPPGSPR